MHNTPVEIILADDHEIFRDGFNLMFKKNEEIILTGEAVNGKELVRLAHQLQPDVIVTDIQMPVMDGIAATRQLTKELPCIGIIALSMYNQEEEIVEILEAGAKGYLIKNAPKSEIFAAIKAVHKGLNYFCHETSQKLSRRIAESNFRPSRLTPLHECTEREIEIIRCICQENSSKEIADKLGISKRTVDWHRECILEKINAKNTVGIVVFAIKNKIF